MRRRDIMHLRSSRAILGTLLFSFFLVSAGAQNQGVGDAFPPQVAPPKAANRPAQAPSSSGSARPDPSTQQNPNQATQEDNGGFVFHKQVEEVVLHATVVDDKQRMVINLDKSAFTVLEDGKPQNIVSFRHEDIPVSTGIVIDNSGSMREKRAKVNQAA